MATEGRREVEKRSGVWVNGIMEENESSRERYQDGGTSDSIRGCID